MEVERSFAYCYCSDCAVIISERGGKELIHSLARPLCLSSTSPAGMQV